MALQNTQALSTLYVPQTDSVITAAAHNQGATVLQTRYSTLVPVQSPLKFTR